MIVGGIAYGFHYAVNCYINGRVETLYREKLAKMAIEKQNQEIERVRIDIESYKSSLNDFSIKVREEVPKVVIVEEKQDKSLEDQLSQCRIQLKNIDEILSSAW